MQPNRKHHRQNDLRRVALHFRDPMSGVLLPESISAAAVKLFALTLIVVEVGAETKSTLNPIVIFDPSDIIDVITSNIWKKVRFC
jgi:hypothetical protein